jgi:hypothetical protein
MLNCLPITTTSFIKDPRAFEFYRVAACSSDPTQVVEIMEILVMANEYDPRVGDWYKSINGDKFEIVALDKDVATIEIQHFDGAVEELDFDSWAEMEIVTIEPPEDWSGSLDIERADYGVDLELTSPNDHINPLDDLE